MLSGLCADGLIGGLVWQASPSRDRLAMVFCFVVVFFLGGGRGGGAGSGGFRGVSTVSIETPFEPV